MAGGTGVGWWVRLEALARPAGNPLLLYHTTDPSTSSRERPSHSHSSAACHLTHSPSECICRHAFFHSFTYSANMGGGESPVLTPLALESGGVCTMPSPLSQSPHFIAFHSSLPVFVDHGDLDAGTWGGGCPSCPTCPLGDRSQCGNFSDKVPEEGPSDLTGWRRQV